jgi:hypothetical protein
VTFLNVSGISHVERVFSQAAFPLQFNYTWSKEDVNDIIPEKHYDFRMIAKFIFFSLRPSAFGRGQKQRLSGWQFSL